MFHSLAFVMLAACALAPAAFADVIVVRPSSQIIISENVEVGVFRDVPEPITRPYDPSAVPFPDSIKFWFLSVTGGITAGIHSNELPNGTWGYPPQTPSLTPDGRLDLVNTHVGPANTWIQADISDDGDSFRPSALHQAGIFGYFQLQDFAPGESAYVGFSDYELARFGYVQIRRIGADVLVWELVGYAYDDSGASILVRDLSFCAADLNSDGLVDILDFLDFIQSFSECENLPAPCGSAGDADFNGDTTVDILDFLGFIDAFAGGCD